jgi:hypothetical protein
MGKKCIPGVFCIENMTLFLLFVIILLLAYFYYQMSKVGQNQTSNSDASSKVIIIDSIATNPPFINGVSTRNDIFNDPYSPPLKTDGVYFRRDSGDVRGIPVNIQTHGTGMNYQQVGILTKSNSPNSQNNQLIMPLMGRKLMTGREKWQYYTMATNGNMNTKLPLSVNGKSCTSEYGCDSINNGDNVYVEGYNDTFKVTVYENSGFNYIPFL